MQLGPINGKPTKRLFINTLTKDVSLIDAILDLVDNAIDGYTRHKFDSRKEIKLSIKPNKFEIWDNCGGIKLDHLRKEVFQFGVIEVRDTDTLGVYGIGLKRAIFKIGNIISLKSDDSEYYYEVDINLNEWEKKDGWDHEFTLVEDSKHSAFTSISVTDINEDISKPFEMNSFINELIDRISRTYFLFLQKNVDVFVNDIKVEPIELKIGFSDNIAPAVSFFKINGVEGKLVSGPHPDIKDPGWYVFFNSRLIIAGNREKLTGWGDRGVPQFHPKYNRFKGFAYLNSTDPSLLPWNTSKNGLDTSSSVYKALLIKMQTLTQKYTSFMSKAYPTENDEKLGIEVLGDLKEKPMREFIVDQEFRATPLIKKLRHSTITYSKPIEEINLLKANFGRKGMSNKKLGELTFQYYKEMECQDDE